MPSDRRDSPPLRRAGRRRPEIQALRALAVALVVAGHVWPGAVPGGFVGVDVFFAISGFLITSLLLDELARDGTISLRGFWARRARRILPAALLVLLACAVATPLLVPPSHWERFLAEIVAATAYVENWQLAHTAVDYFAAGDAPSPVQHYWSLSIEEQFYLAWPLVLLVAARRGGRRAAAVVLGVLTAASFAYGLRRTAADPTTAYFLTPGRAWEFAAGALLALAPVAEGRAGLRGLLSWAGLAAIATAAVAFSAATPFPGVAALVPVGGALAVIAAGMPERRWAPTALLGWRPVTGLGDVSYAVYLWHWPLLVLAPYAGGAPDGAVVAVTLVLAWLSTRLVEDPVRRARGPAARPAWRTFAPAAVGMAVVLAATMVGRAELDDRRDQARRTAERTLQRPPDCFGAAARDPRHPCDDRRLAATVVPEPVQAEDGENAACEVVERLGRVRACAFGTAPRGARRTVALLGDSHAAHWRAALEVVARRRGWHGLSVTHTGCPFTRATPALRPPARDRCVEWNRDARRWLGRHPEITTVVVAAHAGAAVVGPPGAANLRAAVAGYRAAFDGLPASVRELVVLRDTPRMRGRTLDCVQRAMDRGAAPGRACAVPRPIALKRDAAVLAARQVRRLRVRTVDLTAVLCERRRCPPVIGGALVYRDEDHLTAVFSRTLGPLLDRELTAS